MAVVSCEAAWSPMVDQVEHRRVEARTLAALQGDGRIASRAREMAGLPTWAREARDAPRPRHLAA